MKIDNKSFYSRLGTLALPIAFQSLMLASVAAGDALMLGRIAQEQMTAVSLATQIQFVQNMFIMAATGAGSILGAQYFGKGDRPTVRELFSLMLRVSGLISLAFFLACEFIPGLLMHIFTHDPALIAIGSAYLRIAGWSYLITGVSQCYLTMMKVTDHVCAERGVHVRPAGPRFRQAMPAAAGRSLFWGVGFTSYTAVIGHMGSDAVATNSVAAVVRDLICCVCDGIGSAAGIMVGKIRWAMARFRKYRWVRDMTR